MNNTLQYDSRCQQQLHTDMAVHTVVATLQLFIHCSLIYLWFAYLPTCQTPFARILPIFWQNVKQRLLFASLFACWLTVRPDMVRIL